MPDWLAAKNNNPNDGPDPIGPKIMGIVNVTPDSFSDGGQFHRSENAISHGLSLVDQGADLLDIGGESTRPGADPVDEAEELSRVLPVIEGLSQKTETPISIDTRKPLVAQRAIEAGASIWNDVTALSYAPNSIDMAASLNCSVILMHASADPKVMQNNPQYENVVEDIAAYLQDRVEAAIGGGLQRQNIMVDPGIGFGKSLTHNLLLLANLDRFSTIAPVLLGASRKRFIAAIDRDEGGPTRLGGSIAAVLAGAEANVACVRVHDVAETRQALAVFANIRRVRSP